MKITYINEVINLETYCGDDLNHFILDLIEDLSFSASNDREKDYEKAYTAIEQALDYIIHTRKN